MEPTKPYIISYFLVSITTFNLQGLLTKPLVLSLVFFISFPILKINSLYNNIGEGNGTPLQYSCLENPMDKGAWWAAVHGVSKSWT